MKKNHIVVCVTILLSLSGLFSACSESPVSGDGTNDNTPSTNDNGLPKGGPGVYVAGHEFNGSKNVAKYWKDGVAVPLSDGTHNVYARSIFVTNGDVYVAGYELTNSKYVAKYWKNGVAIALTDGTQHSFAYSIVLSGTNVYVAGC